MSEPNIIFVTDEHSWDGVISENLPPLTRDGAVAALLEYDVEFADRQLSETGFVEKPSDGYFDRCFARVPLDTPGALRGWVLV